MSKLHENKTADVDAYMAALRHPLAAEVQALRELIKGASPKITEQVKWNAPSFSCGEDYVVTFQLRATQHVHLVWHHPRMASVTSPLLVDPKPDGRRMTYLADRAAVDAARPELERILRALTA